MDELKIKWYGTASILLDYNGNRILFDPFFPLNKKVFMPDIDEFAAVEHIFVSHGHFDHIADIPAVVVHGGGKAAVYCTEKPAQALVFKGLDKKNIRIIKPGDKVEVPSIDVPSLEVPSIDVPAFKVNVFQGRHIMFNKWLIIKTFLNPRLLIHWANLMHILKEGKHCEEGGETLVYEIILKEFRIMILGSLNLDENTEYPKEPDLLIMPFQGRSDICTYAMQFIEKLMPKKIMLDHFDNSFPPISSEVKIAPFLENMKKVFPDIPVIIPRAGTPIHTCF